MGADCATPVRYWRVPVAVRGAIRKLRHQICRGVDLVTRRIAVYAKSWTVDERSHERQLDAQAVRTHVLDGPSQSDLNRRPRESWWPVGVSQTGTADSAS
jgi:hypothetical protein